MDPLKDGKALAVQARNVEGFITCMVKASTRLKFQTSAPVV